MNAGPCRFYLVAPVTRRRASDQWAAHGLDGGVIPGAYKIARALAGRLQQELNRLREAGADADSEVDPHPMDAIHRLASREEIDEIMMSTTAAAPVSLDGDGSAPPHRARRKLSVTHISGPAGPSL